MIGAWMLSLWLAAPPGVMPPPATLTISGTVVAASSNLPLADVSVRLVEIARTARTDARGRFVFDKVIPGSYTLTVSTIGYIFVRRHLETQSGLDIDMTIPLAEGTGSYQDSATVTAEAARADVGVSSSSELGSADLLALRGVAGDDPMRAVQALPGVVAGDEFQAQFSMRGSASRQVGVIIDGVATPLLLNEIRGRNDSGSLAMINSDVLDRAVLEAGPRPARDGEWLGASVDFDVREGSRDRAEFRGAASGTSASFVAEGPIGTGHHGSWLISARQSYLGWLIQKLDPTIDSRVNFADTQSKLAYDITPKQEIQVLVIGGTATYTQGNTSLANGLSLADSKGVVASVAWRYTTTHVLFTERVSYVRSTFLNSGKVLQELGNGQQQQVIERADALWTLSPAWSVDIGVKAESQRQDTTLREFSAPNGTPRETAEQVTDGDTRRDGAWTQLTWRTRATAVSAGVRVADDTLTHSVQDLPWLLAEHTIGRFTLRSGAGGVAQLEDIDVVKNAVRPLAPEQATGVDLGADYRINSSIQAQVTAYGRDETNGLRLASETRLVNGVIVNAPIFPTFETTLDGRSRGVEFTIRRRAPGGLTGWVSYAYGRTLYRDVLTNETFPGDFDQRHTFNMFVQQRVSYRTTVNAKLRIGSNVPIVGYFSGTPANLQLASVRNEVRLPTYARLDMRADRTFTFTHARMTLFMEVINVLGRQNLRQSAGSVSSAFVASGFTEREVPFVPSIGMRIEF